MVSKSQVLPPFPECFGIRTLGRLLTLAGWVALAARTDCQEVTRSVSSDTWNDIRISTEAAAGQVRVKADDGSRFVGVQVSTDEASTFADSAETLLSRQVVIANPRDQLKFELEMQPVRAGDDVSLVRRVTNDSSTLELFFSDRDVVRPLHVSITIAQATAFIASIRQAARDASELASGPPARATTPPRAFVYFEFQVEKAVAQIPGYGSPRYPEKLRASRVEGEVLAQFVVDESGMADLATFKILRATDPAFEYAVRVALPNMRFKAAETGGNKVKQLVQQSFQFTLGR